METFDPKHITITLTFEDGSKHTVKGYAETMMTITRDNPMWNTQVGSTGTVVRVKTNDTQCNLAISLQQSSPTNDVLSAIATSDETDSTGVFTIEVKYLHNTTLLLHANDAFIEKKPDATWANSPSDREWVIKCPESDYNLGVTTTDTQNFPGPEPTP